MRGFLLGSLTVLGACGPAPPAGERLNLLVITVDTLRADRIGAYGAERPTPGIDGLARAGAVFEQAWAASSWTLPSLATLMTGRHARSHGAVDDRRGVGAAIPTLAERLDAAGFATLGIGSHIFLGERFGLQRGFGEYDDELVRRYGERRESHSQISSPRLSDKAIDWLEARGEDERWFLWVHYFDPHHLYQPHEGLTRGDEPVERYEGEVAFTDLHVARLLARLEALGLADETLVVFVADHGEEFGEHGGLMHRRTLYEEVLRVPLIVRVPGLDPRRVQQPVAMVDLAPTIYELLDLAPPPGLQGRSLAPALRGEPLDETVQIAELEGPQRLDALRSGRWKLIIDPRDFSHELYDLVTDPGEQQDLAPGQPQRCADLLRTLQDELARAERGQGTAVELDATDRASLDDLGYGGDEDG